MLRRFAAAKVAARAAAFGGGAREWFARIKVRRKENKSRDLFGLSIATHVILWIVAGLVVVAITLFLFWISFDRPHLQSQAANGVGPAALFNAAKLALAVVAGIGGVVALVVAFRRQRLGEADHERQDRATARDETRLFTERFARATEQLGSDQAAVRVAGVYALAGLADDWPTGRQTCVDVLCAYLRMPFQLRSPLPEYESDVERNRRRITDLRASMENPDSGRMAYPANEEHQVRSAVLKAMRNRMNELADVRWSDLNLDFTGAVFDEAMFDGFLFEGCYLQFGDCTFVGETTFTDSKILNSFLQFENAAFLGPVGFEHAQFEDSQMMLTADFYDRSYLNFEGLMMRDGDIEIFGPSRRSQVSISFINSFFERGTVRINAPEISGRRSKIAFDGAVIEGTMIVIHGRDFGSGSVRFNRAAVNGGLISFRPVRNPPTASRRMKFAGTEFSFDGLVLQDGSIRFGFINIEGSVIHFDDLKMKGGEIRFRDVDLDSGSVRMDRSAVTGGSIDLGDIAGTESGRAIASEVGEFLRAVAPLEDEGAGDPAVP